VDLTTWAATAALARRPPHAPLLPALDRPYEYWERQVHCLAVWLIRNHLFTVDELRRAVEQLDDKSYAERSYYEKWAAAIAALLVGKQYLTRAQIEAELGDATADAVSFNIGDVVRVRGEEAVRRWRRPHLRVPGYLHGAVGRVTACWVPSTTRATSRTRSTRGRSRCTA
jgi:hypothetical protein